jgi:hypothetical protein
MIETRAEEGSLTISRVIFHISFDIFQLAIYWDLFMDDRPGRQFDQVISQSLSMVNANQGAIAVQMIN